MLRELAQPLQSPSPMKHAPAIRCVSVTKSGVRCSLKCAPWGEGNLCRTHAHLTPTLSNEELARWVRDAANDDPERLKLVASLLLEPAPPSESRLPTERDGTREERRYATDAAAAQESPLKRRMEEEAARGWARFRQKLQKVTSYVGAQTLADAVPRDARERERTLHVHLGRFLQTRVVPDAATADERIELEVLLLRLSGPRTTPGIESVNMAMRECAS